jgi:hypothetical protein
VGISRLLKGTPRAVPDRGILTVDFGTPSYEFTVNICTYFDILTNGTTPLDMTSLHSYAVFGVCCLHMI